MDKEINQDIPASKDDLQLQLSEIEMLKSMFPDESEFCIDDEMVECIRSFAEGDSLDSIDLPRLEYAIHLIYDKGKLTLHVALPVNYPSEPPDIYIRSDHLSRHIKLDLNSQLSTFLDTLEKGDLIVGSAIAWLQEHADEYFAKDRKGVCVAERESGSKDGSFNRLWIYSHHIYSKVKRKDIKELSEEYQLTGFCLPGKPGLICVEGLSKNTNDWWHTVRSWNWQKILCKKQEEERIEDAEDLLRCRRFHGFEELGSGSNIRVKLGGFHVDMGDLFRFLREHDSGYMFEEFFGVPGK